MAIRAKSSSRNCNQPECAPSAQTSTELHASGSTANQSSRIPPARMPSREQSPERSLLVRAVLLQVVDYGIVIWVGHGVTQRSHQALVLGIHIRAFFHQGLNHAQI